MVDIGIIGGTGKQGNALAMRLLRAGHSVRIGSRSQERGEKSANELKGRGFENVTGGDNAYSADAEVVVISIPADQIRELLPAVEINIGSKIVIDMTVNLTFGKIVQAFKIDGKSTLELLQETLPSAKVVTSLKTISFAILQGESPLNQTDFQVSRSEEAFKVSSQIASSIGLQPVHIPFIEHAHTVEAMVALGIQINKKYKGSHAGYLLTNLKQSQ